MTSLPENVVLRAVAHAADAVVIVDAVGTICFWNDGAVRIFGYGPETMLGSTLDAIIPERLRRRHHEAFRAAMARGSTRYGASDLLAVPARHADGRTVSIEFSVVLLEADDGSVGYVAAILRDVTERRAREQELRRRIEALEENRQPP
jgi:PAS domain S-box-containing protein